MGYAIRNDGTGWRSVNSQDELLAGESYSDSQPEVNQEIAAAELARSERDRLLNHIYDPAVLMLMRLKRTAPVEIQAAIDSKISELDAYANALQNVPEQAGFPNDIQWPEIPNKEL